MATTNKKANTIIAPPIDQRETFVSLSMSKGLGETDSTAMEQKLRALYQIQQTDTKIDRIYLLRGELPLEVSDLEDEIEGLRTRISNANEDISAAEADIADFRNRIEECKRNVAKYEEERNNVKNSREFDSLTKEIEYQELDQQSCQKKINEAGVFIQGKKDLVADAQQKLSIREEDLVSKKKELETIIEETSREEEQLVREREALVAGIDERMMVAYNKVRSNAHNKLAVVTVKRDACGGCFNKIPPQRQIDIASNKKIIVCEYCGRILVSPEFEKGEQVTEG